VRLLVLAACSILALVFCVFGYVFLIASGVVGLAHPAGISWVWTFCDCARSAVGCAQPNDQAVLSRDIG